MEVRFENCKSVRVVCVRHVGPYQECGAAWEKLRTFAAQHNLFTPETLRIGIGHDNPEVTPADKLRYDACLTVDDRFQPTGEVNVQELPGGEYAVVTHRGSYSNLTDTWRRVFRDWVPKSGRELRSGPCFEIYVNDPSSTPTEDLVTEINVPLKS